MGKKLDALLGRNFKASKFKVVANLAISRLSVLKNKSHSRCSTARSDVLQLLNLGHHERALLRVEQVIKEQNMLDAFLMIEGYCHLLIERLNLLKSERECPGELKEAVSSLIFAGSRCGEFPELQEMRDIFTSRFGKEYTSRALQLRNNCGVNPKIIQKMSARVSLENRLKVLKEIASENNIILQLDQLPDGPKEEQLETDQNKSQLVPEPEPEAIAISEGARAAGDALQEELDNFSEPMVARKTNYRDVADAAQAAFESAAYAAVAARAAVELSRPGSYGPTDRSRIIEASDAHKHMIFELQTGEKIDSAGIIIMDKGTVGLKSDKVHPADVGFDSDQSEIEESKHTSNYLPMEKRSVCASDSDSESGDDEILNGTAFSSHTMVFNKSDDEETEDTKLIRFKQSKEPGGTSIFANENFISEKFNNDVQKKFPIRSQAVTKISFGAGNPTNVKGSGLQSPMKRAERPVSVRTRRGHGH